MRQAPGFTLVETMLAVLLMALLASAAVLSFAEPLRTARGREAVDELIACDAGARQTAREQGRALHLTLDPAADTASRYVGQTRLAQVVMPAGYRIGDVLVGRRMTRDSRVEVEISPSGWSRSYAIHVKGPGFNRWVAFAGLGGQASVVQDEETVRSIIADAALPAGHDAD